MKRTKDVRIASAALKSGKLAAFATETVYGLGADAGNDKAVAAVFAAKERPAFNPLIAHVASLDAALMIGEFNDGALALAKRFWPGPLTIVVPKRPDARLSLLVTAGLDSIAIRVPAHTLARQLLQEFGGPVAAPSANPSGAISPTRPEHVIAGLGGKVDVLLDGGACQVGVESTIVSCLETPPVILRQGGISQEALGLEFAAASGGKPASPGQLKSHYAPRAAMRLDAVKPLPGEALLAFGRDVPGHDGPVLNLSPSGDVTEAAANLFAMLHQLDETGAGTIAVMPVPAHGLGAAINDRLSRAAAPRN